MSSNEIHHYVRVPNACVACNKRKVKCIEKHDPAGCLACRRAGVSCIQRSRKKSSSPSSPPSSAVLRARPPPSYMLTQIAWALPLIQRYFDSYAQALNVHPATFLHNLQTNNVHRPLLLALIACSVQESGLADEGKLRQECMRAAQAELDIYLPCIETVQAILLMTPLMITKYDDYEANYAKVGVAIRMAQMLQLHKVDEAHSTDSFVEKETKRRVWWNCFLVDRMCSIGGKYPMMIQDDECQVAMPSHSASWWSLGSVTHESVAMYNTFLELTQIGGMVTRFVTRLENSKRTNKPWSQHLQEYIRLHGALSDWRTHLPPEMQLEKVLSAPTPSTQILVVYAFYYMNLFLVHHGHPLRETSRFSAREFEFMLCSREWLVDEAIKCGKTLQGMTSIADRFSPLLAFTGILAAGVLVQLGMDASQRDLVVASYTMEHITPSTAPRMAAKLQALLSIKRLIRAQAGRWDIVGKYVNAIPELFSANASL